MKSKPVHLTLDACPLVITFQFLILKVTHCVEFTRGFMYVHVCDMEGDG